MKGKLLAFSFFNEMSKKQNEAQSQEESVVPLPESLWEQNLIVRRAPTPISLHGTPIFQKG